MPAIQNFVERIVDYAGLFPPAALPLSEVIENYASYSRGEYSWMLGRLILPAARLEEFSELAAGQLPTSSSDGWVISALVPAAEQDRGAMELGFQRIAEFNRRHANPANGLAVVDTVEIKAATVEQILQTADAVPESINAFLELPHQSDPGELLAIMTQHPKRLFAKIRTGGVTRDLIPPPNQVARFVRLCAKHAVGFKATAGLHHPLRGKYPLTYETEAMRGTLYGFVNVFAAACFAFGADASQSDLVAILRETEASQFKFTDLALSWKNLDVTAQRISEIRMLNAVSFGSCSFGEPSFELANLGLLANVRI